MVDAASFAACRALGLQQVLGGRAAEAVRVLTAAVRRAAAACAEAEHRGAAKRRRVEGEGEGEGGGVAGLVRALGSAPPAAVAAAAGEGFVRGPWAAALELLAVALACQPPSASLLPTPAEAEALARYLDALPRGTAGEVAAFRSEYGGSAALPWFAAAVVAVRHGCMAAAAFRDARPALRRCLQREADFAPGLFLLGLSYARDGDHQRAAQLFFAAHGSADAARSGLRAAPCLLMAGVAHGHARGADDALWLATQRFQSVLQRDAGSDGCAALYNVAAVLAMQARGPSDAESASHREAAELLMESLAAAPTPAAQRPQGAGSSEVVLLQHQHAICRRAVQHMAARAALRCSDWCAASTAYADLLEDWNELDAPDGAAQSSDLASESSPMSRLGDIDCVHREYALALLRAAEVSGVDVQARREQRRTAVMLCGHVLRYRPHDVVLLLLMSEAEYELGHHKEALAASGSATQILEQLMAQQLAATGSDGGPPNTLLTSLAACSLPRDARKQVVSLLVESYHQQGVVLWRLQRHTESVEMFRLADRRLTDGSAPSADGTAEQLPDQVAFSLTTALWACGRRREAARRWAAHRRWELGRNAEYYATKLSAVRKILDCVVEARTAGSSFESVAQQKHLMDRLVLEQLSKD